MVVLCRFDESNIESDSTISTNKRTVVPIFFRNVLHRTETAHVLGWFSMGCSRHCWLLLYAELPAVLFVVFGWRKIVSGVSIQGCGKQCRCRYEMYGFGLALGE